MGIHAEQTAGRFFWQTAGRFFCPIFLWEANKTEEPSPCLPVSILCLMLGFVLRTTVRRNRDLFWFLGWGLFTLFWMVHIFCTSRAVRLFSVTGLIAAGVFWWLSEKKERALAEEAGDTYEDRFDWL